MGDLTTVDGLKAELVRAFEDGDAARAASLYEPRRRAGEQLLESGKYLAVFRRQPDGTWRWATDMWNSDAG